MSARFDVHRTNGTYMGRFRADDCWEALDAMAESLGFEDFEDMSSDDRDDPENYDCKEVET